MRAVTARTGSSQAGGGFTADGPLPRGERRSDPRVPPPLQATESLSANPTGLETWERIMRAARSLPAAAAAAAAALIIAGPGQAQQAGATALHEAESEVMVQPFNLSSTALEDMNLLSSSGEEIGEVEKVLVDTNGRPVAITAEVGGFLGVGQKAVVIGLDRLQLKDGDEPDVATTLSKEELQGLEPWSGR
jgi:hypothetical protein